MSVIEIMEDHFVEQFVAHAAFERLADPVLRRLAGGDEMPVDPATWRPEIGVSAVAARRSLVTSSITLRMRMRRPLESRSWAKSTGQRAFGLGSTRIGARIRRSPFPGTLP